MLAVAERSDGKRKPYLAKSLYNLVLFRLYVNFIYFSSTTSWAVKDVYPCPVNILTLIIRNRSVRSDSIEIFHQCFVSFCRSNVQRRLALAL
jgi:hypothetical protein